MLNDSYYVLERENNDNHPLFSWDQKSGLYGMGRPVAEPEKIKLKFGDPIPIKVELVDFHETPAPVISEQLTAVLMKLDIYGVQLVPAEVRDPRDPFSPLFNYYLMNVWNRIACIDKEMSTLDIDEDDGRIWDIEELVLDEDILGRFDLDKRLVFQLAEKPSRVAFHPLERF